MNFRADTRAPLKQTGRPNQYFAVGDVGRKTGWQPRGDIARDEEGFEDIEQFFGEENGQQYQPHQFSKLNHINNVNSSILSPNQNSNILSKAKRSPAMEVMPSHTADFEAKPLVGRTPISKNTSIQTTFLNEHPTRRTPANRMGNEPRRISSSFSNNRLQQMSSNLLGARIERSPSGFQAQPFAPQSQSKLRNSMTPQDFYKKNDDEAEGGLRSRLAQERVVKPVTKASASVDSDEEEGGSSSLRKRLGLSNFTISSNPKPVVELSSVIKSISMKAQSRNMNKNQTNYSPAPVFQQPTLLPSNTYEEDSNDFQNMAAFEQNLDVQEPEEPVFQENPEPDNAAYNEEPVEEPVFRKPAPSSVQKKKAVAPSMSKRVEPVEEEANYFADSNFDDNYGYEPQHNRISSSPGLDDDFKPISDDDDDVEPAFEEEEEEEPIKPIKKSKSKTGTKSSSKYNQKAGKKQASIPRKFLEEGEQIGPNAVKIPVERINREDDDGLRKSKRAKIAPVAFWKNEKAVYGRRDSGITLQNVIRVFDDEGTSKKTKSKHHTITVKSKASKPKTAHQIPEPPAEIKVINYVTKQEEYQKIAVTPEMLETRRTVASGEYSFQKVFGEGEFIASGVLELPSGSSKPSKNSHGSAMVFIIVSGHVEVQVHKTTFQLSEGGQFFVPRGNQYSITNIGSEEAKLYFCHGKQISSF